MADRTFLLMKSIKIFSRASLSKDYFYFVVFTLLSVLVLCSIYSFFAYQNYKIDKDETIAEAACNIEQEMNSIFEESASLLHFLGEKISNLENINSNLEGIASILNNTKNINIKSMTNSYVSWANSDGEIIVTKDGIKKKGAPTITDRQYFVESKKKPWTLQFSSVTRSSFTHSPIIPIAMGINDNKNNFIGYLIFSIKIDSLNKFFNSQKKYNDIDFIVFDSLGSVVFKSSNFQSNESYHVNKINYPLNFNSGWLLKPIKMGPTVLSFLCRTQRYPYTILTGIDQKKYNRDFFYQVLPSICQFLLMGAFFAVLLFFFRKLIINPITTLSSVAFQISNGKMDIQMSKQNSIEMQELAKGLLSIVRYIKRNQIYKKKLEIANKIARESEQAKENFITSVNKELGTLLEEIIIYSRLMIEGVQGNLDSPFPPKTLITFLEKVYDATICLQAKTTNSLNFNQVDLHLIMKECIKICENTAFSRDVRITFGKAQETFFIWADELKLKQIMVSVLFRAIQNSPRKTEIKILLSSKVRNETKIYEIIIQDQSFGLSEYEIIQIQENIGSNDENHFAAFLIVEKQFIEKLIREHGGELYSRTELGTGETLVLLLPAFDAKLHSNHKSYSSNVISIRKPTINQNEERGV